MIIQSKKVWLAGQFYPAQLEIEDEKIVAVLDYGTKAVDKDYENNRIVPGFIDIHFHGAMGRDAMDADFSSLQVMSNFCAQHGVTSYYPTTWSASQTDILDAIICIKEYQHKVHGAQILGVHIEGP